MFWYAVTLLLTLFLDLFSWRFQQADKDLEIVLLFQQLRILERKLGYKPRIRRWEKCLLVVVAVKLMQLPRHGSANGHDRFAGSWKNACLPFGSSFMTGIPSLRLPSIPFFSQKGSKSFTHLIEHRMRTLLPSVGFVPCEKSA